ncbi:MAG: DNA-directed RNA polymerase subunit beta [Armatimonadota bacterium]|nr:DNA-directed RNA polymerase subunit beta [Armatimonadota bacterium]MCX7777198.1 DNA-directed RNA polymerase subunit beta [Armatimonadota bacterium]MDW8025025.1 DNA-directed RNA polymerase subunit beta [Armatimonadota bacterium]
MPLDNFRKVDPNRLMFIAQAKEKLENQKRLVPPIEMPNLIEFQLRSYEWFINEGIKELFETFSPIEDYTGTLALEFVDYSFGEPDATPEQCCEQESTYAMPFKVRVRLVDKVTGEAKDWSDVYLGDIPCMTPKGTFIINGAERTVVSQLGRSPGVYFHYRLHELTGRELYSAQVIAKDGGWIEFETDAEDVLRVRIGQSRFMPVTMLMRAFSALPESRGRKPQVTEADVSDPSIVGCKLAQVVVNPETGEIIGKEGDLITEELQRKMESCRDLRKVAIRRDSLRCSTDSDIIKLFGRCETITEITKDNLKNKWIVENVVVRGKTIVKGPKKLEEDDIAKIINAGLSELTVWELPPYIDATLEQDPSKDENMALLQVHKLLRPQEPSTNESARNLLNHLFFDKKRYDLGRVGRYQMNRKLRMMDEIGYDVPLNVTTFTLEDLICIVFYLINLRQESEMLPEEREKIPPSKLHQTDDIDHLSNKRLRCVGELVQSQLRLAFFRMERAAKERMTTTDRSQLNPQAILSIKPIMAAIKSFFSSGQLSQFMQQTNPLDELEHKRRMTALGPGGISRESAKGMLQLRDVHPSHYGRICPIQTPEGPNIGLISSLTVCAYVDEYGFIRTPYRVVQNGRVTNQIVYLAPDEDANHYIAPADTQVDKNGLIVPEKLIVRGRHPDTGEIGYVTVRREEVTLMDATPMQCFSVATSLIPFLEHDDANRALMGSNMQRQAVPLIRPEAPLIKTGMEAKAARDSGALVIWNVEEDGKPLDGKVTYVDGQKIEVVDRRGKKHTFNLYNFMRSNQGTCIHQKPIVRVGQRVKPGEILADGPATERGELALGRNLIVAFMPWEGYNYEDAIVISERLVKEDVLTSIHIEKYETQARETKLGPEEITRDVPNVSEEKLKNIDEDGIVRIGAQVKTNDILVGKAVPKVGGEHSPEEKLIIALFGKKAEDMKDASLRVPHGEWGTVISVKVFARYNYECKKCRHLFKKWQKLPDLECPRCGGELKQLPADELKSQVNMMVRVYVAQTRKITVGDKLSGRHGNKGVVAKILPESDMPYLPDGTPVDIIFNPLGVPSRMNVGQILETHLGLIAALTGTSFEIPIFQGMNEEEILKGLAELVDNLRKDKLYDYATIELGLNFGKPESDETYEQYLQRFIEFLSNISEEELEAISEKVGVGINEWRKSRNRPRLVGEHISELVKKRVGYDEKTGRCILYDGRTGEPFHQPVTVGSMYVMKLIHLVEDKIHARATGPYSLVTQQPLGGKAQFGGQRFGEMEVWALEAYGAAHTLEEMLTIKSDDIKGREDTFNALIKGQDVVESGIPESFKILVKELQSLGLQVISETKDGTPVEIKDEEETEPIQPRKRR